jgi:hypothetical protein
LFDSVEERHRNEVHAAEALARQKVANENPEVGEELLNINFSQKVKDDDARRRGNYPNVNGVAVPVFPHVDHANWEPPPIPRLHARLAELHNQARLLQQQAQDRQRLFDQHARAIMQPQVRAYIQGQAQLLQGHPIVQAQQAPAQQKPVAQLGDPQPFGYPEPYIIGDLAPFPPALIPPAARRVPAAVAVSAAPAVAAPIAPAAPAAPPQPKADDRLKPLRYSNFVAGRRNTIDVQAGIRPGSIVRKCNQVADAHNNLLADPLVGNPFDDPFNSPFAQQFAIQFGAPWAPGAAIQAHGQAAQPGHRPNQQQGSGARNKTGVQGSQFPESFAAENAGLAFPDIGDFPIPDILGFANTGRQAFAMPEIHDPVFPSPAWQGRQ